MARMRAPDIRVVSTPPAAVPESLSMSYNDSMAQESEIFAELFVCFFFQTESRFAFPDNWIVVKVFNNTVKRAAAIIREAVKSYVDFQFFEQLKEGIDFANYIRYSARFQRKYFAEGFAADRFLYYAVHMTSMAYCFSEYGADNMIISASNVIVDSLESYVKFYDGWKELSQAAQKIAFDLQRGEDLPSHYQDLFGLEHLSRA